MSEVRELIDAELDSEVRDLIDTELDAVCGGIVGGLIPSIPVPPPVLALL